MNSNIPICSVYNDFIEQKIFQFGVHGDDARDGARQGQRRRVREDHPATATG